jgi:hypothetical protein
MAGLFTACRLPLLLTLVLLLLLSLLLLLLPAAAAVPAAAAHSAAGAAAAAAAAAASAVQIVGMKQEIKDYLTSKNVPWEEVRGLFIYLYFFW